MGRIPREIVDAIRDRTDIAAVVGRRVKLQKAGNSLKGLCPFHQEKTPSFHVIPSKGIFHCFGCQESGDVFGFLMKLEGLSFVEAVKELAGPAGVTIEEQELSPEQRRQLRARATLFDVLEEAASWYESLLWTRPEGQTARDYVHGRGLPEAILREARLGYAPDGWSRLLDHLHQRGFPARMVADAGLARPRKGGDGHYDFFRNRLMFPIRDDRGRVIGFGGRVLPGDDAPKYFNNAETPLYAKSTVLYGIEAARSAIQRSDRVIVVEGYFDVLALRAAGHYEVVASCGTALTPDHMKRLSRLSRNLVLLTDGDRAGQEAAARALPLIIDENMQAFRVDLPGAKDPAEYLVAAGEEALSSALDTHRQGLIEWVIDRKVREQPLDSMRRRVVLQELEPILVRLPNQVVPKLAPRLGVKDNEVLDYLRDKMDRPADSGPAPPPPSGWRPHRDMVHIFWLLVHRYDQVADLVQALPTSVFSDHPATHPALARLLTGEPVAAVLNEEGDPGVSRTLSAVVARGTLYSPEEAPLALAQVVRRLLRPRQTAAHARSKAESEAAIKTGDFAGARALLERHAALKRAMDEMDAAIDDEDVVAFMGRIHGA